MTHALRYPFWQTASGVHRPSADAVRIGQTARSLQLGVGLALAVVGAEALIVPTQFARGVRLPYGGQPAAVPAWGIAFIAVGVCLSAVALVDVRRRGALVTGLCAALLVTLVCASRLTTQFWVDAGVYGCVALVLATGALFPAAMARTSLGASRYLGTKVSTIAQALLGLTLIGLGLASAAVRLDWISTALYIGLGVALLGRPWLIPVQPLDVGSVRVRLVLMTVLLTSGSLILATLAIAASAESTAIADALADQRLTAGEVAHNLTQADSDYRGLVTTLAARGGFGGLDSDQQRVLLQGLTATNVYAFSTYDNAGQSVARSDDLPMQPLPEHMLMDLQQRGAAVSGSATVPGTSRPALVFAAPYRSGSGDVAGYAAAELEFDQLNHALASVASVGRSGTSLFVLDGSGTAILHPPPASTDAATGPPSRALGGSSQAGGSVRYRLNGAEYAAAFEDVPALGWSVVSTYPIAYSLKGVQTGREWAFGLLVLTVGLSTVLGLFLADKVVTPLNQLGNAMDDLTADAIATPLPHSRITEVQRLTELFATTRQRLLVRTADRQRALDSAREAIRVREEFMSIAAHELKTPVTATRGHAQLLLTYVRDGSRVDPARLRDSLERINSQSHKLARLIDQLLDVARLEQGTLNIQPRSLDLRDLVAEVLVDRPERGRIVARMPDEPVIVNADFGRLEQVLSNLLDNAVKFSPHDAAIDVEVSMPTSATARLTVSDRGLGIPTEHRTHIFERFHQAHADSHRSGFGLGLYIAKQIVDLHAGTIGLDCPRSGGTRVSVDLPRAAASAASAREAA